MKRKIIEIAEAETISDIGFCSISDYIEEAKTLETSAVFGKNGRETEIFENARTAIVCAFNYYAGEEKGNISRYAQGEDYHVAVMRRMKPITEALEKDGFWAKIYADTGVLNERLLAVLSGIAFVGRNRMAISPKFGSYFFIGYILTDCEIEKDKKLNKKCAECGRCEKACPLGALKDGFFEEKCLSYITQKKGELSKEEQNAIMEANTVWGCDICQEVCPHNKGIPITDIDEFKKNRIVNLEINENISNSEFKKIYGNRAFSWRGKGVIIRNQKILQKNIKKFQKKY
jgi:epoxyqueuosine reductase QueG